MFAELDEPDYIDCASKERHWDAVQLCVDDQVRAGIDVIADGQQNFESETMHGYGQVFHCWGHHLQGFRRWGEPVAIDLYRRFHARAGHVPVRLRRRRRSDPPRVDAPGARDLQYGDRLGLLDHAGLDVDGPTPRAMCSGSPCAPPQPSTSRPNGGRQPDCGMLNVKWEHAQRKLQALVEGTRLARQRLS